MPTLKQLSLWGRPQRRRRCKVLALAGSPQKRGMVYKMAFMSPRKPNSAKRRLAKVRMFRDKGKKRAFCHVPGHGDPSLQEYSIVMVEGGSPPDVPGVNYSLVRGLLSFIIPETILRMNRRSKFGAKRFK